jgi:hypothetical protein
MKKIFILSLLIFSLLTGSAQLVLHDPVTGRTFDADKYSSTRGTPFLFEKWMPGTATLDRGIYTNLELKLDAYNNLLYFNRDDQPHEFIDQINSFTLISGNDTLYFRKGITGSNLKADQYVQVLADGKLAFYKSDIKSISEMSEINAGIVKTFTTLTRYYINRNGKTELVKLNKGDILEYMKDKKDMMEEYMNANKVQGKKEADLVKIIRYYNRL